MTTFTQGQKSKSWGWGLPVVTTYGVGRERGRCIVHPAQLSCHLRKMLNGQLTGVTLPYLLPPAGAGMRDGFGKQKRIQRKFPATSQWGLLPSLFMISSFHESGFYGALQSSR